MSSDEDKLNQLLAKEEPLLGGSNRNGKEKPDVTECAPTTASTIAQGVDFCQWSSGPNDTFRPSGPRREKLPSGIYVADSDPLGPYFMRTKVVTDNLIELDDAATTRVLSSLRKFWKSREQYVKRGVLYKRGLLLWGPRCSMAKPRSTTW
jgi:hypothetical protein